MRSVPVLASIPSPQHGIVRVGPLPLHLYGLIIAAGVLIAAHVHPFLATTAAFVAGALAGTTTGLLHTRFKINALLSGLPATTTGPVGNPVGDPPAGSIEIASTVSAAISARSAAGTTTRPAAITPSERGAALQVGRPHAAVEPVAAVVGAAHGLLGVLHAHHGRRRLLDDDLGKLLRRGKSPECLHSDLEIALLIERRLRQHAGRHLHVLPLQRGCHVLRREIERLHPVGI